ncbi:MAG: hypothetical protein EOO20_04235 [Chryseobacterium sp.]|nr:MAG: hypothetical protein EOO20_04235 [Chryseobacterium sp.]
MTAYRKLFSVNVLHNYYEDSLCQDLDFIPANSSRVLMRNQRWIYKAFDTGFNLICETDQDQKAKIRIGESNLYFGIVLKQAAKFLAITNLNEANPQKNFLSNKKIYLTNNGLNKNLKYSILDAITGDLFNFNFDLPEHEEVTLRLKTALKNDLIIEYDTNGAPISSPYKIKKNINGTFGKLIDLSKLPDGLYIISVKNADDSGSELLTYKIFKSAEIQSQATFGILHISIPANEEIVEETKFSISFTRKETFWKYYVINQSGIDLEDFDLFVKDKSTDGHPVYKNYTFAGKPVPTDDHDPINKIADVPIVLFKSNIKIPFFEKVKTGLELSKKDGSTEVILTKNLPNPMPEKQAGEESKVYVYV